MCVCVSRTASTTCMHRVSVSLVERCVDRADGHLYADTNTCVCLHASSCASSPTIFACPWMDADRIGMWWGLLRAVHVIPVLEIAVVCASDARGQSADIYDNGCYRHCNDVPVESSKSSGNHDHCVAAFMVCTETAASTRLPSTCTCH